MNNDDFHITVDILQSIYLGEPNVYHLYMFVLIMDSTIKIYIRRPAVSLFTFKFISNWDTGLNLFKKKWKNFKNFQIIYYYIIILLLINIQNFINFF